jgi:uncharacterized protein (DUF849 family)
MPAPAHPPLQACLNGQRTRQEHPGCPTTPEELGRAAREAAAAGASGVHVHIRDDRGAETLDGAFVAAAIDVIRTSADVPVGVSTGAWIEPDPDARLRIVTAWEVLPDFASVNFHEPGAATLAQALLERGLGVEAGIWCRRDGRNRALRELEASGVAPQCLRVLVEPIEPEVGDALAAVAAIDATLRDIAPDVPHLVHGFDATTWALLEAAARRGDEARIGLEDTLVLRDGSPARDNAHLVAAAAQLMAEVALGG